MNFLLGARVLGVTRGGSVFLCVISALLLASCKSKFVTGHFSGNLTTFSASVLSHSASQKETLVDIEIVSQGRKSGVVFIRDEQKCPLYHFNVKHVQRGVYQLTLPFLNSKVIHLKKKGNCYLSELPIRADVCFSDKEFVLNLNDSENRKYLKISATPFQIRGPYEIEDARKFSLSEAVDLALEQNLDARVEYEKMTQAALRAKAAWLSLFPRLSVRCGMPLRALPDPMGFAITTVITSLGDFFPVFLPSRWFKAYSSSALGEAERVAFRAMRANLATQIEGVAHVLDQQSRIHEEYQRLIRLLDESRPRFLSHVESKALSMEKFKDFEQMIEELKLEEIRVKESYLATKRALASMIGLRNPDGIVSLDSGVGDVSISSAMPLQREEILKVARGRSFELEQIQHLIQSARYDQRSHWWLGLDSTGDASYSFGPALPTLIAVDQSKIRELEVMASKVDHDLAQRVYELVEAHNSDLQVHASALDVLRGSQESLAELIRLASLDGSLNPDAVVSKTQRLLRNLARYESIFTDFRVSRSRIDRLLLRGVYERLLPKPSVDARSVRTI